MNVSYMVLYMIDTSAVATAAAADSAGPLIFLDDFNCTGGLSSFRACIARLVYASQNEDGLPLYAAHANCLLNHREQNNVICKTARYNFYLTYVNIGHYTAELQELSQVCMGSIAKTILTYYDGSPEMRSLFWDIFKDYLRLAHLDIYNQYCDAQDAPISTETYYRQRFEGDPYLEFDQEYWCNDEEFNLNVKDDIRQLLGEAKYYTPSIYLGLNYSDSSRIEEEFNLFQLKGNGEIYDTIDLENLDAIYTAVDTYEYGAYGDRAVDDPGYVSMTGRQWLRSEDWVNGVNCTNALYYCNHNSIGGGLIRKHCPKLCQEAISPATIFYGVRWCTEIRTTVEVIVFDPVEPEPDKTTKVIAILVIATTLFLAAAIVVYININKSKRQKTSEQSNEPVVVNRK